MLVWISVFFTETLKYLGYILSNGSISSDPVKVSEIVRAPPPDSKTAMRRFLCMCGVFHRRMIPNCASSVAPLHALTHDGVTWGSKAWRAEHQHAFEALKDSIARRTMVYIFDPSLPPYLLCDASASRLAYALYPLLDGDLVPVFFGRRVLTSSESKLHPSLSLWQQRKVWRSLGCGWTLRPSPRKFLYCTQLLCSQRPKICRPVAFWTLVP